MSRRTHHLATKPPRIVHWIYASDSAVRKTLIIKYIVTQCTEYSACSSDVLPDLSLRSGENVAHEKQFEKLGPQAQSRGQWQIKLLKAADVSYSGTLIFQQWSLLHATSQTATLSHYWWRR